jgi:hypothetical protein
MVALVLRLANAPRTWVKTLLLIATWLGYGSAAVHAQAPPNYADYKLLWAEEFNQDGDSTLLAPRWGFAYPWGRNIVGNAETEYYTGTEVHTRGGLLHLTATRLAQPRRYQLGSEVRQLRYTAGMLHSLLPGLDSLRLAPCPPTPGGFGYGMFEVRCRLPKGYGAFPAFWLAGHDEFDILEAVDGGFGNNAVAHGNAYWRPALAQAQACQCLFYSTVPGHFSTLFHTYTLRWEPGQLTFYFDGVPIRRETRFRTLGCPLNLIVNLAMWNWASPATDTLAIDYIRVWQPRQPPAFSFAVGDYRQPPVGYGAMPRWEPKGYVPPPGLQTWTLAPDSLGRLRLNLTDNHNPPCSGWQALPTAEGWRTPWLVPRLREAPVSQVTFGGAADLSWALTDGRGRVVLAGTAPAGQPWRPSWPVWLKPGAYWLRLRLMKSADPAIWHPFYVVDFPEMTPDAAWLAPPNKP